MPGLMWTFVAPMVFYCAWQLCYFVIVQVGPYPLVSGLCTLCLCYP